MAGQLPERFIGRPASEFEAGLHRVTAWYWHLKSRGEDENQTALWVAACGSLEAMHWLAGYTPFPPAYSAPLPRTRSNLMRLARYSIMVLDGEGEELDREDPAAEIIDVEKVGGAGTVYRWALRMTSSLPGVDLIEEEIRAAQRYYQAHARDEAA